MKTAVNFILTHGQNRAKEDNSVKCKDKFHVAGKAFTCPSKTRFNK